MKEYHLCALDQSRGLSVCTNHAVLQIVRCTKLPSAGTDIVFSRSGPGSHKRNLKQSHDPNDNEHPTTRGLIAKKQQDLELEQRCRDHIITLRLSAEENLPDVESFKGVDWLKEVEAIIPI
jgi:hypothetical protein